MGREICHLGLPKGPIGLKNEFYGFIKSRLTLSTSSPGHFSLALEVGREKRPGDEVVTLSFCEETPVYE